MTISQIKNKDTCFCTCLWQGISTLTSRIMAVVSHFFKTIAQKMVRAWEWVKGKQNDTLSETKVFDYELFITADMEESEKERIKQQITDIPIDVRMSFILYAIRQCGSEENPKEVAKRVPSILHEFATENVIENLQKVISPNIELGNQPLLIEQIVSFPSEKRSAITDMACKSISPEMNAFKRRQILRDAFAKWSASLPEQTQQKV